MIATRTSFLLLIVSCAVPGQVNTPTSAQTKRTPAPANYDYAGQIRAMEDLNGPPAAKSDAIRARGDKSPQTLPDAIPNDFQLKTDIPLTPTAQEAVEVSEKWRSEKNSPAAGTDGRVMYSFGAGLPTVVCAPLRVCIIELQAGERIEGEPQIGDSVRWILSPGIYGTGDQATAVIVLKPQASGLDTNLLVTTDRRAYYLRLISIPEEYVARVAFHYPDDDAEKWQRQRLEQRKAEEQKQSVESFPAVLAVEKMNFGYKITGANEHIRPLRVFDDGAKTYIQMPAEVQHREAPVLVVLGSDGKGEMTNYRVKEQMYIVDRLFEHAQLVLGSGKKAQKVEIVRENRG
jgi:type IV secretion system protein TrbG